jgi:hypothetical protein
LEKLVVMADDLLLVSFALPSSSNPANTPCLAWHGIHGIALHDLQMVMLPVHGQALGSWIGLATVASWVVGR